MSNQLRLACSRMPKRWFAKVSAMLEKRLDSGSEMCVFVNAKYTPPGMKSKKCEESFFQTKYYPVIF